MIRPAVRSDLPAIARCLLALDRAGAEVDPRHPCADGAGHDAWTRELGRSWFDVFRPIPPVLVAERGGAVVGVLVGELLDADPETGRRALGDLRALWVEPGHRRSGVGRALVDAFRAALVARGVTRVQVTTLVRDARAVAFWRALGFLDQYLTLTADVAPRPPR